MREDGHGVRQGEACCVFGVVKYVAQNVYVMAAWVEEYEGTD